MATTSYTKGSVRDGFLAVYEVLKKDLLEDLRVNTSLPEDSIERMARLIDYNVTGGKLNRGITVTESYALLLQRQLTEEEFFRASTLGWCIEWLQACFLVLDDVMDGSITRRGQPCWYQLPDIKLDAVNDGMILESHIYRLLRKYFSSEPTLYLAILELFHETTYQTELGQLLDLTTQPANAPINVAKFTYDNYKRIVRYKTAYYSFYIPVAAALALNGQKDEGLTLEITLAMGEYFQIQDDYLDCYGDPAHIGKIGTDIEDCKCSWLAVTFLNKAEGEDREKFLAHYGKKDPQDVAIIKELYRKLKLEEIFNAYEEESKETISKKIAQIETVPKSIFEALFNKIYKRSK